MKSVKKVIFTALVALYAVTMCMVCMFGAGWGLTVSAEEVAAEETGLQTGAETAADGLETADEDLPDEGTEGENNGDPEPTESEDAFTEILIEWLQSKYGAEYRTYYDFIITEWESAKAYVENVLSEAVEEGKMTEESAGRWQAFIEWLHEYTVIWCPVVVLILLAAGYFIGKKLGKCVKELFNKLFKGNNQNANALLVALDSIEILLGNTEKTKEQREKIEKVKEELEKDV